MKAEPKFIFREIWACQYRPKIAAGNKAFAFKNILPCLELRPDLRQNPAPKPKLENSGHSPSSKPQEPNSNSADFRISHLFGGQKKPISEEDKEKILEIMASRAPYILPFIYEINTFLKIWAGAVQRYPIECHNNGRDHRSARSQLAEAITFGNIALGKIERLKAILIMEGRHIEASSPDVDSPPRLADRILFHHITNALQPIILGVSIFAKYPEGERFDFIDRLEEPWAAYMRLIELLERSYKDKAVLEPLIFNSRI